MDVFALRDEVIGEYADYVQSFFTIRDRRIRDFVEDRLKSGVLWPRPMIQLNPAFEPGPTLAELVQEDVLHPVCEQVFRAKPTPDTDHGPIQLYTHQVEAIRAARRGESYVLCTGTGSGKSLAYIVPIVDHVLRQGSGRGIQAIVVYPMNALANSQLHELDKYLRHGFPQGRPVRYERYTGQEDEERRKELIADPPDILLTNYVMLELILTRPVELKLIQSASALRFLVLDELHTYRGRQGADVAMLMRRVRGLTGSSRTINVGTSATLATEGAWPEQQARIARVASDIFGAEVLPSNVIGETLRPMTTPTAPTSAVDPEVLKKAVEAGDPPSGYDELRSSPLCRWMESALGLEEETGSHRLVRREPRTLRGEGGAAEELATLTGLDADRCETALRAYLLAAHNERNTTGHSLFPFRLHQFVSRGEAVHATLEAEGVRELTLRPQHFLPGSDRQRILLPLAFCRECGQEYYTVRRLTGTNGLVTYWPRELSRRTDEEEGDSGLLYINTEDPWPSEIGPMLDRLPEDWLEQFKDGLRVKRRYRSRIPKLVHVSPAGEEGRGHLPAHFIEAPFLFCMACGVDYTASQRSDFGKLATLGSEGRSTATTVLSLSSIRRVRADDSLPVEARKLLSFTDNRQDASLQAGHFNDFVEIALMRTALVRALGAGLPAGLSHERLTSAVFEALDLPLSLYAQNPAVKYVQKEDTEAALRDVLGYMLYRDLRRGWRVTSPNLEQCGLLVFEARSLADVCGDEDEWKDAHEALGTASPEDRQTIARVLIDHLRRELAIRVTYLDGPSQDQIKLQSNQYLVPPWALDENERMERSRIAFPGPRASRERDQEGHIHISARSGFGQFLRRASTLPTYSTPLNLEETDRVIASLMAVLAGSAGILAEVIPAEGEAPPGYQLNASALLWRLGDGQAALHDPVRVPSAPDEGLRVNPYFREFYTSDLSDLRGLEGHEHTAQVPADIRVQREEAFRTAELPVLYCSPTMELGVDIKDLNVVNMRNVPPTPANYAQRSGRAGRGGQPAFVFTYCAGSSPHDQYFFKRPSEMVAGRVQPPRLDLANEDLLRSHVHAIWLTESRLNLKSSLGDVLDLAGDPPDLRLQGRILEALHDQAARGRAFERAREDLGPVIQSLLLPSESVEDWLRHVLDTLPESFDRACDRWRGLYRGAYEQSRRQQAIILDHSRTAQDRKTASRLRAEAESQLELLRGGGGMNSDFYVYRYFASEGFLPGYNFPRLPLSAYLPGRRRARGKDDFLSRPRFLAISEFGPRAIVYHEGSKYVINKVLLTPSSSEAEGASEPRLTQRAVLCDKCGYLHDLGEEPPPDLCKECGEDPGQVFDNLFRMQNVTTRRRDKIHSDEEERLRYGYEMRTGLQFTERRRALSRRTAEVVGPDGAVLVRLVYGHAARLWRVNLGWKNQLRGDISGKSLGYVLDVERGVWKKNKDEEKLDDLDPLSPRTERVIPFVEDHRNCLLLEPTGSWDASLMATLQSAFKAAIQRYFQLEDQELAAEPLPAAGDRRKLLFYEASEGGAGVLRHIVEDPHTFPALCRTALETAHLDPATGRDLAPDDPGEEGCEAACYDCLLSYYNQRDHGLIDRKLLTPILLPWSLASVQVQAAPIPAEAHMRRLLRLTDSELERRWLRLVDRLGLRLPDEAQYRIEEAAAVADFYYNDDHLAIFIDGPHHDASGQKQKDRDQQDQIQASGHDVLRFHHAEDWEAILNQHPRVFGARSGASALAGDPEEGLDLDLYDPSWHPLLRSLDAEKGLEVKEGGDAAGPDGLVAGRYMALIRGNGVQLHLLDTSAPDAARAAEALEAAGKLALVLDPASSEAISLVLSRLKH